MEELSQRKQEFTAAGTPLNTNVSTKSSWQTFLSWASTNQLFLDWISMDPSIFSSHLELFIIMEAKKTLW